MRRFVEHIQTTQEYFQVYKKTLVLEKDCIVAEKGAIGPILREICSPKKRTPFFCPVNGAIA
jgi:hypothetical protein